MMCMLEWILSNLKLIVSGLLVIISVIVFILRKKPIYKIFDSSAYKTLIIFVNEAETKYGAGHGEEKLKYVVDKYCSYLSLDKSDIWIRTSIQLLIENILSTPSKK